MYFTSHHSRGYMRPTWHHLVMLTLTLKKKKNWNTLWICMSSLCRGHAILLCIIPIFVYMLLKWAQLWPLIGTVFSSFLHCKVTLFLKCCILEWFVLQQQIVVISYSLTAFTPLWIWFFQVISWTVFQCWSFGQQSIVMLHWTLIMPKQSCNFTLEILRIFLGSGQMLLPGSLCKPL